MPASNAGAINKVTGGRKYTPKGNMQESTKFNGKSNKEWESDAKRWQKRDIQKLPTMRSGDYVFDYYRT